MNTIIIGRASRITIPEYHLADLPAKVDTGAYSSSIDHTSAEERDGMLYVVLLRPGVEGYTGDEIATAEYETTEVKNANGVQTRYVVFPEVVIDGMAQRCRLTLADRSKLRYPVLIGRRFLREGGYIVDVTVGQGLPGDEEDREL